MAEGPNERHILILDDDNGRRSIALDAATYSLGRDQTNAIVLESKAVSRQHALLLRLPVPETGGYRYRLVDGNSAGRPSANGVTINGQRSSLHNLKNGDVIVFGGEVKASYMTVSMGQSEFLKYLDMINFQSIKSQPLNAKETLVGLEFNPQEIQQLLEENVGTAPDVTPSQPAAHQTLKFWVVGIGGMALGLVIGGGVLLATGKLASAPPPVIQTNPDSR